MIHETQDDAPPYAGLKVVDMSQGVAGPHCGMLFALHGADVIKVEPPDGDWGRAIGKRHGDLSSRRGRIDSISGTVILRPSSSAA